SQDCCLLVRTSTNFRKIFKIKMDYSFYTGSSFTSICRAVHEDRGICKIKLEMRRRHLLLKYNLALKISDIKMNDILEMKKILQRALNTQRRDAVSFLKVKLSYECSVVDKICQYMTILVMDLRYIDLRIRGRAVGYHLLWILAENVENYMEYSNLRNDLVSL
ncbi:hypothetical protein SK128_002809, partial [Halocaridina rubra]